MFEIVPVAVLAVLKRQEIDPLMKARLDVRSQDVN